MTKDQFLAEFRKLVIKAIKGKLSSESIALSDLIEQIKAAEFTCRTKW